MHLRLWVGMWCRNTGGEDAVAFTVPIANIKYAFRAGFHVVATGTFKGRKSLFAECTPDIEIGAPLVQTPSTTYDYEGERRREADRHRYKVKFARFTAGTFPV